MANLVTILLCAALASASCASGSDSSSSQPARPRSSPGSVAVAGDKALEVIEYYDNNIFAIGKFTATPEQCDDPFRRGAPQSVVEYWESVTPESCYQVGAIAMTPPLFDCSDGIDPEAMAGRQAIAGNRVVFDIRSLEIKVTSHVINMCIPIN